MESEHIEKLKNELELLVNNLEAGSDENIEVEMKSPMNTHSAIRLIRDFSASAQIIETSYGHNKREEPLEYHPRESQYLKYVEYDESGSTRIRHINRLSVPTDIYVDDTTINTRGSEVDYDHKRRVIDILFNAQGHTFKPTAINTKFFRISISIEKQLSSIPTSQSTNRRRIIRYDVSQGVAEFLGFKCRNSIITIERNLNHRPKVNDRNISQPAWFTDSWNPYVVEMEWDGTESISDFVHDVKLLHEYIINYHPMTRPEDLNRSQITHSTFFSRGPYRVTVKNNGYRVFVILQSKFSIIMNAGTEVLNPPKRLRYDNLDGTIVDVEVVSDGNVVLDVWHPSMREYIDQDGRVVNYHTHQQRIDWFQQQPNVDRLGFIFKEFVNLDTNYHDGVRRVWNSIQDRDDLYDGIILQPQYRSFYAPAVSGMAPDIYRFKTYQSVDLTNQSIREIENSTFDGYNYVFDIPNSTDRRDRRSGKANDPVIEYRVVSVEPIEDSSKVIVTLQAMRTRPDRTRANQPRVIHRILVHVMENLTIHDLVGTQLHNAIIPFKNKGIFEVIEDRGIPVLNDTVRGSDITKNRVILFPDANYPWPTDGRTVIVVTQSYLRLLSSSTSQSDYRLDESSRELTFANNRYMTISTQPLFPDSVAINRDELNSYIVVKVKLLANSNMSDNIDNSYDLAGDNLIVSYVTPRNLLIRLLLGATTNLNTDDPTYPARICATLSILVMRDEVPLGEDRRLDPYYGPTWWTPTHGYPSAVVLHNFLIRAILEDKNWDLTQDIVTYLLPMGMIRFITLTDQDMQSFLNEVEAEFGLVAACQFLLPFLIMMRIHLGIEVSLDYKGVTISSNVFAAGVNLDRIYSEGDSEARKLDNLSQLNPETDRLSHIPAPYFFKNSSNRKALAVFERVLTKSMSGRATIYSNDNLLIVTPILPDGPSNAGQFAAQMAEMVQHAFTSRKDKRNRLVNSFLTSQTIGTYLPEVLFPEAGLQIERPYTSINWSHNNQPGAINPRIYSLIETQFQTSTKRSTSTRTTSTDQSRRTRR